jgi:hypothetical protein
MGYYRRAISAVLDGYQHPSADQLGQACLVDLRVQRLRQFLGHRDLAVTIRGESGPLPLPAALISLLRTVTSRAS